jgi:hypothetical protein
MRPLPPSPEYHRLFVRRWPGGATDDCPIVVTTGARAPHVEGGAVEVGEGWLAKQAIPRSALEGTA